MEFTRDELNTVPIWVKFPGLDFKYWSPKGLSKIGSLVGKSLMVDQHTEKKVGLRFARLLIEVEMDSALPDIVWFKNERGMLVEKKVLYDWRPILCQYCTKYGHKESECRKRNSWKKQQAVREEGVITPQQQSHVAHAQVEKSEKETTQNQMEVKTSILPTVNTRNEGGRNIPKLGNG
ncbi:hypothetical protein P3S68_032054 [Capsicum galapagoense]